VVALDAGRMVGGAVCYEDEGAWYLGRLAVLPDYRQAGIGRSIVAQVEQMGRIKGYRRITLGARVALPHNRTFFESQGYSLDSVTAHEGYDAPTVFWMSKAL
jgi:GNAT superfamily N-acetyltransferase